MYHWPGIFPKCYAKGNAPQIFLEKHEEVSNRWFFERCLWLHFHSRTSSSKFNYYIDFIIFLLLCCLYMFVILLFHSGGPPWKPNVCDRHFFLKYFITIIKTIVKIVVRQQYKYRLLMLLLLLFTLKRKGDIWNHWSETEKIKKRDEKERTGTHGMWHQQARKASVSFPRFDIQFKGEPEHRARGARQWSQHNVQN